MKDFEVGQKIYYLSLNDGEEKFESDVIFGQEICIRRSTINRLWKNGRLSLDNGKVIHSIYCDHNIDKCKEKIIQHIVNLDLYAEDPCNHDFEFTGVTCTWCGESKSKIENPDNL